MVVIALAAAMALCVARPAAAYSVLAHEANIDALWDSTISKMLVARFPGATAEELLDARAFAYGGCVIQDLGYYPFGSHFFSNLVHYVRTGDFVAALIDDAQDIDEYAFALGALGHYAADNNGHPMAVNRAVPLMYPKLKAQFGSSVTYAESPKSHVLVEFSFDVVQVAAGAYAPATFHNFIGFEVAKPLVERVFHEIYGLEMKDVFFDEDLAIGTYRFAISEAIPNMTKIAWHRKRDEIEKLTPGIGRQKFVFNMSRHEYEKQFGNKYRRPRLLVRVLSFVYTLMPRIGPFKYLSFKPPTPEAEQLFLASFRQAKDRFRDSLEELRAGTLNLQNTDFDTGRATA